MWYMKWVEANRVPDWLICLGIRANLESGLRRRYQAGLDEREAERQALLVRLEQSPIAIDADQANRQHYQVPAEFFQLVLGKRRKYSCCYWPPGVHTLDQAEDAMLQLTCQRTQLEAAPGKRVPGVALFVRQTLGRLFGRSETCCFVRRGDREQAQVGSWCLGNRAGRERGRFCCLGK